MIQFEWWRNELREKLLAEDSHCRYCRAAIAAHSCRLTHIVPLSKGGKDGESNITVACKGCNRAKRDSTWKPTRSS